MTTPTNGKNGFVQKLIITIMSGAALLFFGWLSRAVIDIQIVAGRVDERIVAMDAKITSLVSARAAEAAQRSQNNTQRLNDIQGNAQ